MYSLEVVRTCVRCRNGHVFCRECVRRYAETRQQNTVNTGGVIQAFAAAAAADDDDDEDDDVLDGHYLPTVIQQCSLLMAFLYLFTCTLEIFLFVGICLFVSDSEHADVFTVAVSNGSAAHAGYIARKAFVATRNENVFTIYKFIVGGVAQW